MRHSLLLAHGACWLVVCEPAALRSAHPSSAIYDTEREVRFEGAVTRIDWATPNVFVFVDVRDAAGTVVNWAVQVASPTELERSGWTRSALRIGDVVAITAQPARGCSGRRLARSGRAEGLGEAVVRVHEEAHRPRPAPRPRRVGRMARSASVRLPVRQATGGRKRDGAGRERRLRRCA